LAIVESRGISGNARFAQLPATYAKLKIEWSPGMNLDNHMALVFFPESEKIILIIF